MSTGASVFCVTMTSSSISLTSTRAVIDTLSSTFSAHRVLNIIYNWVSITCFDSYYIKQAGAGPKLGQAPLKLEFELELLVSVLVS